MRGLTAEEVLLCHDLAIRRYGGCAGCADPDRVYALIGRVQSYEIYENIEDPFAVAARYCVAVAQGHVFTDGNKRTAACCMFAVLQRNGITVKNREGFLDIILKVATKEMSAVDLVKYLKKLYAH